MFLGITHPFAMVVFDDLRGITLKFATRNHAEPGSALFRVNFRVLLRKLPKATIRLACLRHAASVHPEPGSNSYYKRSL